MNYKAITDLTKDEIMEICVKCFDYKSEHIVSMRRIMNRPLRWRVTEIEKGIKKCFNVIDPFDYDETILNSGLTKEQWHKFKKYCFSKGVCSKLLENPNYIYEEKTDEKQAVSSFNYNQN